jgi:mannose-1-phosphate guanylyltransferase
MRAIVLVGGEATRMRPLSWRTPKQLMPVVHQPLLERLLRHLAAHGTRRATLALMRRNEAISDALGDGARLGLCLDYAYEEQPLGSGGAIAAAAAGWEEQFLVVNGDIVTDLDIRAMLEAHRSRGAELSIALHEVDDPSPFGVVALGEDDRIVRFVEKPPRESAPSRLINAGVWLFEPSLLEEMDATRFNRVEDGLFPHLASGGRAIYGFRSGAYWRDVGTPQSLLAANLERCEPASAVAAGVELAPGGGVEQPCVIGPGSRIEEGALVSRSLLWEDVHVGARATVLDSVLAPGVTVEPGAHVERSIVAHGATVEAGARLEDASVEPGEHYAAGAR